MQLWGWQSEVAGRLIIFRHNPKLQSITNIFPSECRLLFSFLKSLQLLRIGLSKLLRIISTQRQLIVDIKHTLKNIFIEHLGSC